MKKAARFALPVLVFACAPLFGAGNSVVSVPADVQHFGPLVVVAMHEDSPDPRTLRSEPSSVSKKEKLRILSAFGVDSNPELHALWTTFLKAYSGAIDQTGPMDSSSEELPEINFGEPGSTQIVLGKGFGEESKHPFELRGIYELSHSRWHHIATVACLCRMYDRGVPPNPHAGLSLPKQEWAVTRSTENEDQTESHEEEIRFRLRGGLLWPVIQFESGSRHCADGEGMESNCGIASSSLEKATLLNEKGESVPGHVVVTRHGWAPARRGMPVLGDPKCSAYTWDEHLFFYVPSQLKPQNCGGVSTPAGKPADGQPRGRPSGSSPDRGSRD